MPAAGFLVRLFMIQHDCGHGSFFRRRLDWLGRTLGVLTLTPYGYWRRTHAMHHATSGHLDRRGMGDIDTLTVREYQSLPAWRRALYRLKRHPIVVLGAASAGVRSQSHVQLSDGRRTAGRVAEYPVGVIALAVSLLTACSRGGPPQRRRSGPEGRGVGPFTNSDHGLRLDSKLVTCSST